MPAISLLFSYLSYESCGECIVCDGLVAAIKIQIIAGITLEVSIQLQLTVCALKHRMQEERKWPRQRIWICTVSLGFFKLFSIVDIIIKLRFILHSWAQYIPCAWKLVRFTVSSSKMVTADLPVAGGIAKLMLSCQCLSSEEMPEFHLDPCRNVHTLRWSDSQHLPLYWFKSNLIQLFAYGKKKKKDDSSMFKMF